MNIGEYKSINVGYARDKQIRLNGASGGVASAIILNALNKKIDAAIVAGMDSEKPWKPVFKLVRTKEEVIAAQGSKYTLMNVSEMINLIKANKNLKLGVVGLPCHVQIIRKLNFPNVKLIVGLLCGYNMPYKATEFLLKKAGIKKKDVVSLKYRGGKYPGGFLVETRNKKKFFPKYYYDFLNLMYVPKGCLNCRDYMSEEADISVGDAWGYENHSLVIIRKTGEVGDVELVPIDEEELYEMHGHNIRHKKVGDPFIQKLIMHFLKIFGKYIPISILGWLAKKRREKGILKRIILEYKYFMRKKWSFSDVGRFWNSVHDYDEIDEETYAYKRRFYDSIKMCSLRKGKILDIDCRTGNGTVFYHRNGFVKDAICVGPSRVLLGICKERVKKYGIRAKTIQLKELPLKFKDKSFDSVLCFETIEHVSKHERLEFLKELHRVLKDDGEMILSMPNILWEPVHWIVAILRIHHSEGPHRFLRRRKILKLFKQAGFKVRKEDATVLIAVGPRFLTRFGEHLEKFVGKRIRRVFALRRIYICRK